MEAEKGSLAVVKQYLENGGNPLFECADWRAGGRGYPVCRSLDEFVKRSLSYELVEYYLTYDILQEVLDEMFLYYLNDNATSDSTLAFLLFKKGGKLTSLDCDIWHYKKYLDKCKQLNYDFNWIDPKDGNTLLMKYCRCPAPEDSDKLIETIQYLISLGARTDIKNKEGKTAKEIALNEKVKEFLEGLEK